MVIEQRKNQTHFSNKYSHGKVCCEKHTIEISMMYVEPQYRNKGYGKKLMEYILEHINIIYPETKMVILSPLPLDTEGLNLKKLMGFYSNFGFKKSVVCPKDKPYMMEIILD